MTGTRHAVVAGGGIGGLASAIGLLGAGWRVTVLEASLAIRATGSGLAISRNGLAALDVLGVGDRVRAAGVPQRFEGTVTQFGSVLRGPGETDVSEFVGIHRGTLLEILREAAADARIVTSAQVVGVRGGSSPIVVTDGPEGVKEYPAELVVGADGIDSAVRQARWPGARTDYSGATSWRGVSPRQDSSPDGFLQVFGQGAEFGLVPIDGDRVYWYGSFPARMGRTNRDERAAALDFVRGWTVPIAAHISATPKDEVLRHDTNFLATPLKSFVDGRVVLVGDAAHAMVPTLGQGANSTLEDAATLGVLAAESDIHKGLTAYDALRRPRTQRFQRLSHRLQQTGLAVKNPVLAAARNGMFNLVPTWFAEWTADVMLDWKPPKDAKLPED